MTKEDEPLHDSDLEDQLKRAGVRDKSDLRPLQNMGNQQADDIDPRTASIMSIFNDMREEQLLLYAANLFYRSRVVSGPNYDPKKSDVKPPKIEERIALAAGALKRFSSKEYRYFPETRRIINELKELMDETAKGTGYYLQLLLIAAKLVHDSRGAQWMLSPQSRIAIGNGEMAEFHPNIWMIIQDCLLEYLSPPQLSELYLSPISPKNAGEILRRQKSPNANYKKAILQEIVRRSDTPQQSIIQLKEKDVRQILKNLIHKYKLEMHSMKQRDLKGTLD